MYMFEYFLGKTTAGHYYAECCCPVTHGEYIVLKIKINIGCIITNYRQLNTPYNFHSTGDVLIRGRLAIIPAFLRFSLFFLECEENELKLKPNLHHLQQQQQKTHTARGCHSHAAIVSDPCGLQHFLWLVRSGLVSQSRKHPRDNN